MVAGGSDADEMPGNLFGGFTDGDRESSRVATPAGLGRDAAGRIYLADSGNSALRRYDPASGRLETLVGKNRRGVKLGAAPALNLPISISFIGNGQLLVADLAENSLLLVN